MSGQTQQIQGLIRLREFRVEAARRTLARAQRELAAARQALARRDAELAAIAERSARLAAWFARAPDPRQLPAMLARHEATVAEEADALAARAADREAVETAEAARRRAGADLLRAQARHAGAGSLDERMRARAARLTEIRTELELEEGARSR